MLSTKDQTVRPIGSSICPYVVVSRPLCSLESWCPQPYSKKCMLLSHPDFTSWGIPPTKTFRTCAGRACAPTSGIALQASITKQEKTVWLMMSHWCHWIIETYGNPSENVPSKWCLGNVSPRITLETSQLASLGQGVAVTMWQTGRLHPIATFHLFSSIYTDRYV